MIDFKLFYQKYGVYKPSDLMQPKVMKGDTFVFPRDVLLHYGISSDVAVIPSSEQDIFSKQKKAYIINIKDYTDNAIGSFRELPIKNKIDRKLKKKTGKFKLVLNPANRFSIGKNDVLVLNYGSINSVHKYHTNPLNVWYKYHNMLTSVLGRVKSKVAAADKEVFIMLDLPDYLPPISMFKMHMKIVTRETIKQLTSPNGFLLLELLKYYDKKLRSESVFSNIPKDVIDTLTFAFRRNGNITIVKASILLGLDKDDDLNDKFGKYNSDVAGKIVYLFIKKIIETQGKLPEELEKSTRGATKTLKADDKDPYKSEIDLSELDGLVNDTEPVIETSTNDDEPDLVSVVTKADMESVIKKEEDTHVESIKTIKYKKKDPKEDLKKEAKKLKDFKLMSNTVYDNVVESLDGQDKVKSPFPGDKRKLSELLETTDEDIALTPVEFPDSLGVPDKSMLSSSVEEFDRKFIEEVLDKQLVQNIYALQSANVTINNLEVSEETTILGSVRVFKFQLRPITGKPSTVSLHVPVIEKDGTFKMSGNTYYMRKQQADLPIRKVSNKRVWLSSFYGKIAIDKATAKKDDPGFYFSKSLVSMSDTNKSIKGIVLAGIKNMDAVMPDDYAIVSRFTKSFLVGPRQFYFDYSTRNKLAKEYNIDLSNVEKTGQIIFVGVNTKTKKPLTMNFDNEVMEVESKGSHSVGTIYTLTGIDKNKAPMEFTSIKIYKIRVPMGLFLAYTNGIDSIFKGSGIKYQELEGNKRYSPVGDQFVIRFADKKFICESNNKEGKMLLAGFNSVKNIIKNVDYADLKTDKTNIERILVEMGMSAIHINEINLMKDMFVDPSTLTILKKLKLPETFEGLCLKANELLVDDNYKNPLDVSDMVIKGYERLSGMMYAELVTAMREYNNSSALGRTSISMSPYGLVSKLTADSTVVLVDNLNPIAEMKQKSDVTYLGTFGRSKEAMSRDTREFHPSEIGVTGDTVKDNGDVGISFYLSANPKLDSVIGDKGNHSLDKDGVNSIVGTSSMLAPGIFSEDSKRRNFSDIQNSHTIPMKNMKVPYVRTGYDSIMAFRTSDKFCTTAEFSGVVKTVTKDFITVLYKGSDKTTKVKLGNWTTKEEGGKSFEYERITHLKAKAKFNRGDSLSYVKEFFERDIFDRSRVVMKFGTLLNTALLEEAETYEDASAISHKKEKEMAIEVIASKSFVVKASDNITDMVKVGDKVTPSDILFTITDSNVNTDGMDKAGRDILQGLAANSPKAKVNGKITKIVLMYNTEITDASRSLKKIITESDEEVVKEHDGLTGRVNASYSIKGVPLIDGMIEIKIYIKTKEDIGVGDKTVFANQLKTTAAKVFSNDITGEDGRSIDAKFSKKAISARIVNSPYDIGILSTLVQAVEKNAVDMFFK